jgi:hypothetical protein
MLLSRSRSVRIASFPDCDVFESVAEDANAFQQFRLFDDERRRETDNPLVRFFGEDAPPEHCKANLLSRSQSRIEFHASPEPFASHLDHSRMIDGPQRREQFFAKGTAALDQ